MRRSPRLDNAPDIAAAGRSLVGAMLVSTALWSAAAWGVFSLIHTYNQHAF